MGGPPLTENADPALTLTVSTVGKMDPEQFRFGLSVVPARKT
jgi:hypothetical protein